MEKIVLQVVVVVEVDWAGQIIDQLLSRSLCRSGFGVGERVLGRMMSVAASVKLAHFGRKGLADVRYQTINGSKQPRLSCSWVH